jgi:hypothetical protein
MAQTVVGNHTLVLAEIATGITSSGSNNFIVYPSGSSTYTVPIATSPIYTLGVSQTSGGYVVPYTTGASYTYTNQFSGNNNHNEVSTGGGGAHNHPITMAIQYCDVIMGTKN